METLTEKLCTRCNTVKSMAEFFTDNARKDGKTWICKPCMNDRRILNQFQISGDAYREQVERQQGLCAICGLAEVSFRKGERMALAIDHDPACCDRWAKSCGECIRGLLCSGCNMGLGNFRDSPANLRVAADYLESGHRPFSQPS